MLKVLGLAKELVAVIALCACADTENGIGRVTISATGVFEDGFQLVREIEPEQVDSALIGSVTHLALGPGGRILITDGQQGSILLYGPKGNLERRIGRNGDGPGEFRSAFRAAFTTSGNVVVLDPALRRMQVFDTLGSLRQILPLQDYARSNDLAVLNDSSFLVTVSDAADERVLAHLSPSGEELWRGLAIGTVVPEGEQEGPVWTGARFHSVAVQRDTAWIISTLRSTLWTVPLETRRPSRLEVDFEGYIPPNLPPPSAGQQSAWVWLASKHMGALLQVGEAELYWPFIQGQPYEDSPRMLVRRDRLGRWSVYDRAPMIVSSVSDTLVAVRNPGADSMRIQFYLAR